MFKEAQFLAATARAGRGNGVRNHYCRMSHLSARVRVAVQCCGRMRAASSERLTFTCSCFAMSFNE